ncbi:MAG TPA: T9SS type A sorting domain-containing protein, partial [Flavobacterium sp.]
GGFSALVNTAGTVNFQIADDFTVPAGEQWVISGLQFYGYQTNYADTAIPIDQLKVQIFSSDPSVAGAIPVAGDMTTNVLNVAASGDALMYRIFNTATPAPGSAPGTTRKVWKFVANLNATLSPGTYWVVWQGHPTNDGALFFPPVTVPGIRGLASWNAKQNVIATTATPAPPFGWSVLLDKGNPDTAPDVTQDIAFDILGTMILGLDENALASKITLYPNPVKTDLFITMPSGVSITNAEIYDISGRVVKSVNGAGISYINVGELMSGNYVLKVESPAGIATKKFVKE